jgi:hypothetical protein
MGDIKADPPAMGRFADRSSDRETDLVSLRGQMDAIHLDRGAFGYIPGIGARVDAAYEEFVSGCEEAVTSAALMMGFISAGVEGAADAYQQSDHAAGARIHQSGGH